MLFRSRSGGRYAYVLPGGSGKETSLRNYIRQYIASYDFCLERKDTQKRYVDPKRFHGSIGSLGAEADAMNYADVHIGQ